MLNVGKIENGIVIDHIEAGKSMDIYRYLGLGEHDSCVAIIKNAKSNAMGRKDIIKIDQIIDIDFNMLAVLEPNMTINYIKNGERVEKKQLALPEKIYGIIKCKNPRCITSIEQELEHIFVLTDPRKEVYRCKWCEEKYRGRLRKDK